MDERGVRFDFLFVVPREKDPSGGEHLSSSSSSSAASAIQSNTKNEEDSGCCSCCRSASASSTRLVDDEDDDLSLEYGKSASSDASSSRRRQEEILEKQLLLSTGGNGHADDEDHANKSDDGWKTVNNIINLVTRKGLYAEHKLSVDGDEYFVYVGAPEIKLQEFADLFKIDVPLKTGGAAPFDKNVPFLFANPIDDEDSLFSHATRQRIVFNAIKSRRDEGGCGIEIERWIREGRILRFISLNNQSVIQNLRKSIKSAFLKDESLNQIRDYFGEQVAFFFAWIRFYTLWLVLPSLGGLAVLLVSILRPGPNGETSFDTEYVPPYCILLVSWGAFLLVSWKRYASELSLRWNMLDFEEKEELRDEFRYSPKTLERSINLDHLIFELPIRAELVGSSWREKYYPSRKRMLQLFISVPVIIVMIGAVIVSVFFCMYFRDSRRGSDGKISTGDSLIATLMNTGVILFFNVVYGIVAKALNDAEHYRTDREYEDSLIIKTFLFQFVNSYSPLFYLAFGPGVSTGQERMKDLFLQLVSILGVKQIVGLAQKVFVPLLIGRIKKWMDEKNARTTASGEVMTSSYLDDERRRSPYESPFADYLEFAIQYGYSILFAAAFPPGALLSLISNFLTVPVKMHSLTSDLNRPYARGAFGIGNWLTVLEGLTFIAVFTNAGLICFCSEALFEFYGVKHSQSLLFFVIIEHVLLLILVGVKFFIADVPESVLKRRAEQEFHRARLQYSEAEEDKQSSQSSLIIQQSPLL